MSRRCLQAHRFEQASTGLCLTLIHVAGEQTQIQSLIQKLHRLGFVKHNPAHKTYQTEPYLRPHLVALAQQQPDALYSPSLLGWSHACLRTCTLATALFHLHAQVRIRCCCHASCYSRAHTGGGVYTHPQNSDHWCKHMSDA